MPDRSRYESPVDDIVGNPNSTEMPNISPDTKRQPTSAAVDSVVDHYEALMHRLALRRFEEPALPLTDAEGHIESGVLWLTEKDRGTKNNSSWPDERES